LLALFPTSNSYASPWKSLTNSLSYASTTKVELLTGKGISHNTLRTVYLKGTTTKPVLYGLLKSLPVSTTAGPGVLVINLVANNKSCGSKENYSIDIRMNRL
jgi:hypothetical protein